MMIGLPPLAPIYDTVCRGGLGGVGRGWKGREVRVELEWGVGGGGGFEGGCLKYCTDLYDL